MGESNKSLLTSRVGGGGGGGGGEGVKMLTSQLMTLTSPLTHVSYT